MYTVSQKTGATVIFCIALAFRAVMLQFLQKCVCNFLHQAWHVFSLV